MEVRYKVMTNIFDFRLKMVRSAQQDGVSETARLFEVSRPTVYKWLRRFEQGQVAGLEDRSAAGRTTAPMPLTRRSGGRLSA